MALSALNTALELMMGREKLQHICIEQTRVSVIITLTHWRSLIWVTRATTQSPDSRRYQCCVLCNLMQYETNTHCLCFHKNMSSLADPNFFSVWNVSVSYKDVFIVQDYYSDLRMCWVPYISIHYCLFCHFHFLTWSPIAHNIISDKTIIIETKNNISSAPFSASLLCMNIITANS